MIYFTYLLILYKNSKCFLDTVLPKYLRSSPKHRTMLNARLARRPPIWEKRIVTRAQILRRRVCWPSGGGWVGGNHNNNTTDARTPAGTRRRWFFVAAARACLRRVAVLASSFSLIRVIRLFIPRLSAVLCRTLLFCRYWYRASVQVFGVCFRLLPCWPRKTDTNDRSSFVTFTFFLPYVFHIFPDRPSTLLLHKTIGWKIVDPARTVRRVLAPFPVRRTTKRLFSIVIMSTTPKSLPEESLGGKYNAVIYICLSTICLR